MSFKQTGPEVTLEGMLSSTKFGPVIQNEYLSPTGC